MDFMAFGSYERSSIGLPEDEYRIYGLCEPARCHQIGSLVDDEELPAIVPMLLEAFRLSVAKQHP